MKYLWLGDGSDIDIKYYDTGSQVKYGCEPGRMLFGDSLRQCQYNGQWSGDIPICSMYTNIFILEK